MHVALVVPNLGRGGAERSVANLAGGLTNRGHRVDIVLLQNEIHQQVARQARLFVVGGERDGAGTEEAARGLASPVELRAMPKPFDWVRMAATLRWDPRCFPGPRTVRQARAVASYMADEKPDCVFANLSRATVVTLLGTRFLTRGPAVIPIIRDVLGQHHGQTLRRYRRLFGSAAHFVAVSEGIADDLAATIGVTPERISTVYNPVVTADLRMKMTEPPAHPWLLDGEAPVILAAGRLAPQKDFPTLVKAFARVVRHRPCRLVILGEGKRRDELEALIRELGLDDRVSLPGWTDNPFAFMSRASLFVLSSRHEGLPGVLVQALACGCPCVSTDCPAGPAEILENGRFGPLVPVGDEAALADAMERTLEQPPDIRTLQERADRFSEEKSVTAYEELIRTVAGRGGL